ncbi:unnamed protein product [marine sediment metagenome]|uniref:Uncharacterized protein n=1 Tax=marine sediment metagenome TaxID=412755 RepID=X0TK56_9ZZZZ
MTKILPFPDPHNMPDRRCENCDYLSVLSRDGEEYECRRFAPVILMEQDGAVEHSGSPMVFRPDQEWCGQFKRTSRTVPIPEDTQPPKPPIPSWWPVNPTL